MTLASTELVYQADFMNVSPSADGAVFSGIGNRIITGLVPSLINGAVQVTAGKALVQGRLFELTATKTYTPTTTTGTQYLGLMVDLTKSNVDGGTVTNNQYTVGFFNNPSGNLPMGDSKANIPLFKMTGTTSVVVAPEMNGSIVRNWQPNTQYSIGDLVTFNSLGTDATGKLTNPVFKAIQTHVSDTTFPSSSNTQWQLTNIESAYRIIQNRSQGSGLYGDYIRVGNTVNVHNSSMTGSGIGVSINWNMMADPGTIPLVFRPIYETIAHATSPQLQNIFSRMFKLDGSIWIKQTWGQPGTFGSGVYLEDAPAWVTQASPVWNAGTPI